MSKLPLINRPPDAKDKKAYIKWRIHRDKLLQQHLITHNENTEKIKEGSASEANNTPSSNSLDSRNPSENIIAKAGSGIERMRALTGVSRERSKDKRKALFAGR